MMKMPPKKTNGVSDDRRVLVDREEYAALIALRENAEIHLVDDDKTNSRIHDLGVTCSAQARRLVEVDLAIQHLERINGMQRVFIDLLRADHPAVASLEDLSTFWRTWFVTTGKLLEQDPAKRDEVNRLEPDLFRSWRLWVRDAGRVSRTFAAAGTTRAEVDGDRLALSQAALQDRIFEQQRHQNALLLARVSELEAEVEAHRKGKGRL